MVVQPLGPPPPVFEQEAWKQVLCLVISSACREVCKKLLDIKPIQWTLPVTTMCGMPMFTKLFTYCSGHQISERFGVQFVFLHFPSGITKVEIFKGISHL